RRSLLVFRAHSPLPTEEHTVRASSAHAGRKGGSAARGPGSVASGAVTRRAGRVRSFVGGRTLRSCRFGLLCRVKSDLRVITRVLRVHGRATILRAAAVTDGHERRRAVDRDVEQGDGREGPESQDEPLEAHEDQKGPRAEHDDGETEPPRELLLDEQMAAAAGK